MIFVAVLCVVAITGDGPAISQETSDFAATIRGKGQMPERAQKFESLLDQLTVRPEPQSDPTLRRLWHIARDRVKNPERYVEMHRYSTMYQSTQRTSLRGPDRKWLVEDYRCAWEYLMLHPGLSWPGEPAHEAALSALTYIGTSESTPVLVLSLSASDSEDRFNSEVERSQVSLITRLSEFPTAEMLERLVPILARLERQWSHSRVRRPGEICDLAASILFRSLDENLNLSWKAAVEQLSRTHRFSGANLMVFQQLQSRAFREEP